MNKNITQKHYTGFVKAALASGLSYPQATQLYKQAGGLGTLAQKVMGVAHSPLGRTTAAAGGGGLAGAALGLTYPYSPAPAAAPKAAMNHPSLQEIAPGLLAQNSELQAQLAQVAKHQAQQPPDWVKYLTGGGIGAGLGLGAAGLMSGTGPNKEEEEKQHQALAAQMAGHPAM